jgi:hypothetical protein
MANILKGQGKVAFGIFVDGLELKFAHLSLKGKKIILHDLKKVTLRKKLDEQVGHAVGFGEGQELFPTEEHMEGSVLIEQERTDSNAEVILNLLSQYPPKKYLLTYSLAEPSVYYHTLEGKPGSKNGQLKKRAIEELKAIRSGASDPETVEVIPSSEKGALCIVREDGLHLINLLEEIKPFIGKTLPRIPFIDAADLSLMNLARLDYDLREDEITVILYVGVEYSRIIFMKGKNHLHFAPLITEGTESPNLDNRLYSRILLEQDNLDIPKIHRLILAGNAQKIHLEEFLSGRFPSAEVEYMELRGLEKTAPQQQTAEACAEYAVPIATAWRSLDPKNENFLTTNLLPVSLIERQKFFKLAWHGYALLALIFLSTLFFTWNVLKMRVEINSKSNMLAEKEHRLADNLSLKSSIAALQEKIDRHKNALALYDSLVPGSNLWTSILTKGTNKIRELNSLWLTSIATTPDGGMEISGIALYRSRIPKFAALFDKATLREIAVKEIRERKVYEFDLYVPDIARPGQ